MIVLELNLFIDSSNITGKSESVKTVIDVMDRSCPQILEKCVLLLPTSEKATLPVTANVDLQWLADRASTIWSTGDLLISQKVHLVCEYISVQFSNSIFERFRVTR